MEKDLISKDTIFLDIVVSSKDELFLTMSKKLYELNKIDSESMFYKSLCERENLITTGIGNGIAIPHAKDKTVYSPFLAFIKLNNPIDYDALDNKKVDLIFMMAVSQNSEKLHLEILAKLSTQLLDDTFIQKLKDSKNVDECYEVLKKIESEKLS